jgi:hypothetical protein
MELSRPTQKNGSLQTYSLPKEWNSPDLLLTKRMELSRPTQKNGSLQLLLTKRMELSRPTPNQKNGALQTYSKNGSLQTYSLPKEWSSPDLLLTKRMELCRQSLPKDNSEVSLCFGSSWLILIINDISHKCLNSSIKNPVIINVETDKVQYQRQHLQ